jgi:formamidopyrimidine-DNA glycosylase
MPELPEVETIVRDLQKKVIGLKVLDAWTDYAKTIKTHTLKNFIKETAGLKILHVHRRAKYILIDLSGGKTIIIHQKISGHLLYGKWVKENQKPKGKTYKNQTWASVIPGPLRNDPFNRFIRFILCLDNGYMLGLSDVRRFGKVFLGKTEEIENINEIGKLGPEPLDSSFTIVKFRELMTKRRGVIKKVLMDSFVIAGIGNIYSDEILWYAGVQPLRRVENLSIKELFAIYKYMRTVLKKSISVRGDSLQDFRTLEGKMGGYQKLHKAYQQTGKKCSKHDGGIIKRIKINNRSAHFCPVHQK